MSRKLIVASLALVASEMMYCISCTPLMARSRMVTVDLMSTSALDPGNSMNMLTRGGAISGNCAMGLVAMASNPKNIIASEMEIASTGR